jgi:NAD+ synthase (glutamine-hydrolysing)
MIHILVAQLNPIIGDLEGNFNKVKELIVKNGRSGIPDDLIVFPELTLTGYPPNDLLLRKDFVEDQISYLDEVRKLTAAYPGTYVLIGAVLRNSEVGKPLRNAAICFKDGEEVFRYYKQLLPTYNIFDEDRYFEPGKSTQDNRLVITSRKGETHTVAVLICEDCWNDEAVTDAPLYDTNPVKNTFAVEIGRPQAVITLNASPSNIGKHHLRYNMYSALSKKYMVPFVYVNSVGGQDSLIFDGHSFMVEGDAVYYAKGFVEQAWGIYILKQNDHPHDPLTPPMCQRDELIIEHLKLGIRDYVKKNGFKTVVVGSSGGIDSAVVLMLAKEALGAENVFAVTMPSKYSSAGSVDDSVVLCRNLGIKLFTRPIEKDVLLAIDEYEKAFGKKPSRLAIENLQARIRGRVLMEYSNDTGALVLSTGNKSEMSVGYCTIYGDMCGGLSVIADLYKMEVYSIAKWYNENHGDYLIPKAIIDKEPSAELWEGQKDTDSLPPYPILDAVLKLYLERDLLSKEEIVECTTTIEGMTLKDIKRILSMTDRAEFKRRQAAPVLRVSRRAFGFGRNLPITQKYKVSYRNVL